MVSWGDGTDEEAPAGLGLGDGIEVWSGHAAGEHGDGEDLPQKLDEDVLGWDVVPDFATLLAALDDGTEGGFLPGMTGHEAVTEMGIVPPHGIGKNEDREGSVALDRCQVDVEAATQPVEGGTGGLLGPLDALGLDGVQKVEDALENVRHAIGEMPVQGWSRDADGARYVAGGEGRDALFRYQGEGGFRDLFSPDGCGLSHGRAS